MGNQKKTEKIHTFVEVYIGGPDALRVELETSQHGCSNAPVYVQWVEQRRKKITSSNIGTIGKRCTTTPGGRLEPLSGV